MLDKKLTDELKDFFTLNGIDFDKAHKVARCARGAGKLFFLDQLCIKQSEEINRQKEEIEKLKAKQEKCFYCTEQANKKISEIKAEAYKECIEDVKEKLNNAYIQRLGASYVNFLNTTLDNLLQERATKR